MSKEKSYWHTYSKKGIIQDAGIEFNYINYIIIIACTFMNIMIAVISSITWDCYIILFYLMILSIENVFKVGGCKEISENNHEN